MQLQKTYRKIPRWMRRLAIFGILFFVIHTAIIVTDGMADNVHKADVALVLGNAVRDDSTLSRSLQTRMDKTLELYNRGFFSKIIVSGGTGSNGIPEPYMMKQFLVRRGVPDSAVLMDLQGLNTYMTARNYDSMRKIYNFQSVLVISQFYHITRCKLALRRFGITQNVYSAHGNSYYAVDGMGCIREFFAFYKYLLFPGNKLTKSKLPY
jgi:vancomycin permeability regulator SanA